MKFTDGSIEVDEDTNQAIRVSITTYGRQFLVTRLTPAEAIELATDLLNVAQDLHIRKIEEEFQSRYSRLHKVYASL
jgi:hypothetical protein